MRGSSPRLDEKGTREMTRHRGRPKGGQMHMGDPGGRSQRQLRVGEVIRHTLAEIFSRGDVHEAAVAGAHLTVSEVRVSPDLKHATVFVARLGGGGMEDVLAGLARAGGFLRHEVGRHLTTKFTPDLHFIADTSFDTAGHVLEILRSEPVKADIERAAARGEATEDEPEGRDG